MNLKICPVCNEQFDVDLFGYYHVSRRYIHQGCIDDYKAKFPTREVGDLIMPKIKETPKVKRPKNIKICRWCDGPVDISEGGDEYVVLYNGKRYAHKDCNEKAKNGDGHYVDMMYHYLGHEVGLKYDYVQCEKQRKQYIKEYKYTNEGIYNALRYFYGVKKSSPEKSGNRIGIVPFVYNEAQEYYHNIDAKKREINKNIYKQMNNVEEVRIVEKRDEKRERVHINLDKLIEDELRKEELSGR